MAIVSRQGIWSNATYPWTDQTSAGYMGSIVAEIDAWISAISSNASIVANGMLPVKVREPSDSTNAGVRNGFGYRFPDTSIGLNADGSTYPTLICHGTETSLIPEVGDQFEDDTQNNGFGDLGINPGHYTFESISGVAGYDREAIIFYDTTDGEEFIAVGMKLGTSTSNNIGFAVFKDSDGHWSFVIKQNGFCYDNLLGYWTGFSGPYTTLPTMLDNGAYTSALSMRAAGSTGANTRPGFDYAIQGVWYAANSALYAGLGTVANLGNYTLLNSGTEAVIHTGYKSVAVRVPV